jgi:hypothetical protein
MIRRLTSRLTYANVTATLALFVALGGSSYAALNLPRNSVGSKQIRTAAVRSREVKDRSLGVKDLSTSARKSLRGVVGPTGPAGPAGAAGSSATRYFAVVSSSGQLLAGNATSGGSGQSTGTFVIGFAQPVTGCAYTATLGTNDNTSAPAGRTTVHPAEGRVAVQTYDPSGAPADLPFHLIVAC